jgi:hypothetical protein
MMTCESFRARFQANPEDAAVLGHLRTCDRCLDHAASMDPDIMFRAVGGDDLVPPGGIDAFVDDVMRQVRVRGAEQTLLARNVVSWPRRLAVAATIAMGFTGALLTGRLDMTAPDPTGVQSAALSRQVISSENLTTKPIVETYESEKATILEMPAEEAGENVKMVMIFDENLPVDL